MAFLLNFLPRLMALGTGASDLNRLSEAELLARYPVLFLATAVLLGLGLLCDLYVLSRLNKSRTLLEAEPLLRVGPKPWTARDVSFATAAVVLVLATGNALVALVLKFAHVSEVDAMPWLLGSNIFLYLLSLVGFRAFFRQHQIAWREAFGLLGGTVLRAAVRACRGQACAAFVAELPTDLVRRAAVRTDQGSRVSSGTAQRVSETRPGWREADRATGNPR